MPDNLNTQQLHGVILAGGFGKRFWPFSRSHLPKQFLKLNEEHSLLQSAFALTDPWIPPCRKWVVTNGQFAELTQSHLPEIRGEHLLLEPCGRNTAPAIGLAAMVLVANDPDAVMLVMPADHVIGPSEAFRQDVERGYQLIQADPEQLVLFGVPPHDPATGFGYIERGQPVAPGIFRVQSFREKPDRATAEAYFREGHFFWNCGIFMWRAAEILNRLAQAEPEIGRLLDELQPWVGQEEWNARVSEVFPRMKSISIDYAVLERDRNIAVVEASFQWDDVGSWDALPRILPADEQGNVIRGTHVGIATHNCIVCSTPGHLVGTVGLQDCIIVQTPQATLVAHRDDEQGIRTLLAALEKQGLNQFL